jgi:hypothetical protein
MLMLPEIATNLVTIDHGLRSRLEKGGGWGNKAQLIVGTLLEKHFGDIAPYT